jgi:hypothetical protein
MKTNKTDNPNANSKVAADTISKVAVEYIEGDVFDKKKIVSNKTMNERRGLSFEVQHDGSLPVGNRSELKRRFAGLTDDQIRNHILAHPDGKGQQFLGELINANGNHEKGNDEIGDGLNANLGLSNGRASDQGLNLTVNVGEANIGED